MQISNFKISSAIAVPGEEMQFSFDLTANLMLEGMLSLEMPGLGLVLLLGDDSWQLGPNKSEHIVVSITVESRDGSLETALQSVRAVRESVWTLRAYNTEGILETAEIADPVTYINVRCSPAIDTLDVQRSSSGQPDESGVFLLVDGKLGLSPNADISAMKLTMYYAENATADTAAQSIDLTASVPALLSGVTASADVVTAAFSNASAWNFLFVFGDEYESVSIRRNIFKAFANLHLSGLPTGGVCMGGFSTSQKNEPKFECHYPAYFYGGVALGGMKDISTEEVDTGVKWINGKTIYAKTLVYTGAAGGTTYSLELPEGVENVWLDAANSFHDNYNGTVYGPNAVVNGAAVFLILLSASGAVFRTALSTGGDFYIRIFYTKTSDAPEDISSIALYDADGLTVQDADGKTVVMSMTYTSRYTGEQIDAGIEKALGLSIADGTKAGLVRVGDNLNITADGLLSVLTADDAEEDNTRPITSAAVNTIVGNIDVLLGTI